MNQKRSRSSFTLSDYKSTHRMFLLCLWTNQLPLSPQGRWRLLDIINRWELLLLPCYIKCYIESFLPSYTVLFYKDELLEYLLLYRNVSEYFVQLLNQYICWVLLLPLNNAISIFTWETWGNMLNGWSNSGFSK